jgi:hypothetical protein
MDIDKSIQTPADLFGRRMIVRNQKGIDPPLDDDLPRVVAILSAHAIG